MTKTDDSIRSFEGLRGVAALSVALYHFNGFLRDGGTIVDSFYLFVDLFFILSGFVIYRAYGNRLETSAQLGKFVTRRIGRLYPLHIFAAIFFVAATASSRLLKAAMTHAGFGGTLSGMDSGAFALPTWPDIATNLLLLQGIGPFSHYEINGPSWSISTEFYAYLVFACSIFFLRGRARKITLTLLTIAGFAVAWFGAVHVDRCLTVGHCLDSHLDYAFPRCVASFLLGAFAETLTRRLNSTLQSNMSFLQLIAVGVSIAVMWQSVREPVWAFAAPMCYLMLVLALAGDRGPVATILQSRPCQFLGRISYSIYLIHAPLVFVGHITLKPIPLLAKLGILAAYLAIVLLISTTTFRFIEAPARELARKLSNRWFDKPKTLNDSQNETDSEIPRVVRS